MLDIQWDDSDAFDSSEIPVATPGARRSGVQDFPAEFLSEDVTVSQAREYTPKSGVRRSAVPSSINVTISSDDGDGCLIAIRHASGALTFHPPESIDTIRRSANATPSKTQYRFQCPVRMTPVQSGRRGIISRAIKVIVVEIKKRAIDAVTKFVLQKLASALAFSSGASLTVK